MKTWSALLAAVSLIAGAAAAQDAGHVRLPYADARPIFDALRPDLIPADLRDLSPAERESAWPAWIAGHDAAIRARVAEGDEDSLVNFVLYGTTFTSHPRATESDMAALLQDPGATLVRLRPRLDDFVAAIGSARADGRLAFARRVLASRGIDPATAAGRLEARRYLESRIVDKESAAAARSRTLLDDSPAVALSEKLTLFRDRGLSSDTSLFIDLAVEQALEAMQRDGVLRAGAVRRVAIVGPGLDFTDKLEGYDFYPEQTIQPFALIDSLLRLDLADAESLQLTAFDLSPRVLQHLEAAREWAGAGRSYRLVLPRNTDRPWTPELAQYWERMGNWIGQPGDTVSPPAGSGAVDVRTVDVRPSVVLAITPADLNIVTGRPAAGGERFDLVVATNILLYYDVFEQSLAMTNLAAMLRPGGLFLTNNRVFELPALPFGGIGFTDTVYMTLPGVGDAGDRVIWYQRQ